MVVAPSFTQPTRVTAATTLQSSRRYEKSGLASARDTVQRHTNIYVFGIRGEGKSATHRAAALMAQKRFDAKIIHTHTFSLAEVPTAIKYARERIDGAIKVVVKIREN